MHIETIVAIETIVNIETIAAIVTIVTINSYNILAWLKSFLICSLRSSSEEKRCS
jgi:hypothetical protein